MKVMTNKARRRFRSQWEKTENELRSAGMAEDAIAQMHAFDHGQFTGDMRFLAYETAAGTCSGDEDETLKTLEKAADRETFSRGITVSMEKAGGLGSVIWEEAQSDCVADAAAGLTTEDRRMLSLIYDSGFSMAETARILRKDYRSVVRRMRKIRRRIEKNIRTAMEGASAEERGKKNDTEGTDCETQGA